MIYFKHIFLGLISLTLFSSIELSKIAGPWVFHMCRILGTWSTWSPQFDHCTCTTHPWRLPAAPHLGKPVALPVPSFFVLCSLYSMSCISQALTMLRFLFIFASLMELLFTDSLSHKVPCVCTLSYRQSLYQIAQKSWNYFSQHVAVPFMFLMMP